MDRGPSSAVLIPASGSGRPGQLVLPSGAAGEPINTTKTVLELVVAALQQADLPADGDFELEIAAGAWPLTVRELRALADGLKNHQRLLSGISSSNPWTLVAAASLGLNAWRPVASPGASLPIQSSPALTIHQGTLRSGDRLEVENSVLVLGDVNPGAQITAPGHVFVWGKLRGVAHAGCAGNRDARIVALQLRPLQLRIADAVARGPEGLPPEGLAEEANLVDGIIRLDPATPSWPLSARAT